MLTPGVSVRQSPSCFRTVTVAADTAPTATCNVHKMVDYCTEGKHIATQYCPKDKVKQVAVLDWNRALFNDIKARDHEYLLKVLDGACAPLVGATVKIWHTNLAGSYSGETPNPSMCLADQAYASADFFRGAQPTDANGVVGFDTCFPGWYRGRAVHVHFQVKQGSTSYRVSQLFFPEEVTAAIFSSHAEYASFGQPDTTFTTDNIMAGIAAAARDRHLLTVARMPDGAMLASKVVTVVG